MSIYRQITLLIILLTFTMFAGSLVTNVRHSQNFMSAQLDAQALDTATTLAASLALNLPEGQPTEVGFLVDSMFNTGSYQNIRVEDVTGRVIANRQSWNTPEHVPAWFMQLLSIRILEHAATIMTGSQELGTVHVTTDPSLAYRKIWLTALENGFWFGLASLIAIVAGISLLKRTLRPLVDVEQQADAICKHEFPILPQRSRTRELFRIVGAMNKLSRTVKTMLDELENTVQSFRARAFQSPVTGLPNRTRFMDILVERLESTERCNKALLCLVEINHFKTYNQQRGFMAGDGLLRLASKLIKDHLPQDTECVLAHLNGPSFVILVEDYSQDLAYRVGEVLINAMHNLNESHVVDNNDIAHVGITYYDGSQSASDLLSDADYALRTAQSTGPMQCRVYMRSQANNPVRSASEWRDYLQTAIAEDRLVMRYQPVFSVEDKSVVQYEALLRIEDNDTGNRRLIPAGDFIQMASALEITTSIDQKVLDLVIQDVKARPEQDAPISINLSAASIRHPDFAKAVIERLKQDSEFARWISFEMTEYSIQPILASVKTFVEQLAQLDCQFGIDNVASETGLFTFIRAIRANYMKIDGSFFRAIESNSDHSFFVQTLSEVAHGLDMLVIAESIENEESWRALKSLNVDAGQGHHLSNPQVLN